MSETKNPLIQFERGGTEFTLWLAHKGRAAGSMHESMQLSHFAVEADLEAAGYLPAIRVRAWDQRAIVVALLASPELRMQVMLAMPDKSMAVEERRQREAAEARALAAETELAKTQAERGAHEAAIEQFDMWLGEQVEFFRQNTQVRHTFLECGAKLSKLLVAVKASGTAGKDPRTLHPDGRCACGGGGECAWCLERCSRCGATSRLDRPAEFQQLYLERDDWKSKNAELARACVAERAQKEALAAKLTEVRDDFGIAMSGVLSAIRTYQRKRSDENLRHVFGTADAARDLLKPDRFEQPAEAAPVAKCAWGTCPNAPLPGSRRCYDHQPCRAPEATAEAAAWGQEEREALCPALLGHASIGRGYRCMSCGFKPAPQPAAEPPKSWLVVEGQDGTWSQATTEREAWELLAHASVGSYVTTEQPANATFDPVEPPKAALGEVERLGGPADALRADLVAALRSFRGGMTDETFDALAEKLEKGGAT